MQEDYLHLNSLEEASIVFGRSSFKTQAIADVSTNTPKSHWLYSNDSKVGSSLYAFLRSDVRSGELSNLGVDGLVVGVDFISRTSSVGSRVLSILNEGVTNLGLAVNLHADIYQTDSKKMLLDQVEDFLVAFSKLTMAPILIFAPKDGFTTFITRMPSAVQMVEFVPQDILGSSETRVERMALGEDRILLLAFETLIPSGFEVSLQFQRKLNELIRGHGYFEETNGTSPIESEIPKEFQIVKDFVSQLGKWFSRHPIISKVAVGAIIFLRKKRDLK